MRIEGAQCVAFWAILSHLELVSQTIERPFQEVSPEEALKMIAPYPDELLHIYTVSKRVGKVAENDEDLLKEVKYDDDGEQGSLF